MPTCGQNSDRTHIPQPLPFNFKLHHKVRFLHQDDRDLKFYSVFSRFSLYTFECSFNLAFFFFIHRFEVEYSINGETVRSNVCSDEQFVCIRAINSSNDSICQTCEPNSVSQCRPYVALDKTEFDAKTIGEKYPCWIYDYAPFTLDNVNSGSSSPQQTQSSLSVFSDLEPHTLNHFAEQSSLDRTPSYRIFLGSPEKLFGYPAVSSYWLFGAGIAGIFFLFGMYFLAKGQIFSLRNCRNRTTAKHNRTYSLSPNHTDSGDQGVDNGARCCLCFRTKKSYLQLNDDNSIAPLSIYSKDNH